MGKTKQSCHICDYVTKTPKDQEPARNCLRCDADLQNEANETLLMVEVASGKEAGGIKADIISIHCTDKRLIFMGEMAVKAVTSAQAAGMRVMENIKARMGIEKDPNYSEIIREDITAIDEEVTGLFKGSMILTISTKNGTSYSMKLSKKSAKMFRDELNKSIANA